VKPLVDPSHEYGIALPLFVDHPAKRIDKLLPWNIKP
jgi:hypothetical protein